MDGPLGLLLALATSPVGVAGASGCAGVVLLVGSDAGPASVRHLAAWVFGGAIAGGLVGGVLVLANVFPATLALSLGVAFGGGFGAVTNLLLHEDAEPESTESIPVSSTADDSAGPVPEDLFDGHPDPVLYVVDEGTGPVVRAANDAFVDVFGVTESVATGSRLDEVAMAEDADAVATAVADGGAFDKVLTCETADGDRQFRIRRAGEGPTGYVVYTPTEW